MSLEITRDLASGKQTLWGNIPELRVHEAIGVSMPPFVCGISVQPRDTNISPPRPSRLTRIDCGNPKEYLEIRRDEHMLRLGTAEVQVPSRAFVVHEALKQPLPPERDCDGFAKTVVLVSVSRESKRIYLNIPVMGIKRQLSTIDAVEPLLCYTTVLGLARRMDFGCLLTEFLTQNTHLAVQGGVLFVENGTEEQIDGLVLRTRVGFELPCNADVQFKGFDYRSPRYQPPPNHCEGECWMVRSACDRRCSERFSDEQGRLTTVGEKCTDTCRNGNESCSARCRAPANGSRGNN